LQIGAQLSPACRDEAEEVSAQPSRQAWTFALHASAAVKDHHCPALLAWRDVVPTTVTFRMVYSPGRMAHNARRFPGSGSEILKVVKPIPRLRLQGFNNLTKALSFNIYDICYAVSEDQRRRYIEYIDEAYNAERLTTILTDVAEIIGANILNVARQDYDPQGASVTILISEEPVVEKLGRDTISDAVVAHLDKSHITVHTYPETHPHNGIATFRADIDVATCGVISPLKALNFLIDSFESDIVIADYRVRGFTRDVKGRKHYMDHRINSVQEYLAKHIRHEDAHQGLRPRHLSVRGALRRFVIQGTPAHRNPGQARDRGAVPRPQSGLRKL